MYEQSIAYKVKTVKKVGTTIKLFTIIKAAIFIYIFIFWQKEQNCRRKIRK